MNQKEKPSKQGDDETRTRDLCRDSVMINRNLLKTRDMDGLPKTRKGTFRTPNWTIIGLRS
jgi:hypothetical protein